MDKTTAGVFRKRLVIIKIVGNWLRQWEIIGINANDVVEYYSVLGGMGPIT